MLQDVKSAVSEDLVGSFQYCRARCLQHT